MSFTSILVVWFGIALPAAILVSLEFGRRAGVRWCATNPDDDRKGLGPIETAIFALMGLLIAFTFSGAASRFDHRRELLIQETNAIGNAYLRLRLLPPAAQPAMKDALRRYVDSRLAIYSANNHDAVRVHMGASVAMQAEIWEAAVAAVATGSGSVPRLVLPAIQDMFDISTMEAMARRMHPPTVVFIMLIAMVLAGSVFAGFQMAASRRQSWLHIGAFATLLSVSLYTVFELEYPRAGFIRVDDFDQALIDLRSRMK